MEWENIIKEIDNKYCFLKRINAEKNGFNPSALHPILRFSAGLFISAIFDKKCNRIVMLFPNRFNLDKWITVLSVFKLLKNDYNNKSSELMSFKSGQKLLINNKYIVEFESIVGNKIWIKASDSKNRTTSRIGLQTNRILQFEPIQTKRRLSPSGKVWKEYQNAPETPIDSILNINTSGNKSIFESNIIYVGRIGKTVEFINNTKINKSRLVDLFLWGKLDTDGKISIITPKKIQASPPCIISPDLYSVVNYCNFEDNKSKAIVISNTAFCKNDPQSLNFLLDSKIPIIVLTDLNDLSNINTFVENNFKIWQWNESNLKEITKNYKPKDNTIFATFNKTLKNISNLKINTVTCNYAELENVSDEISNIRRKLSGDNDELWRLFSKLYQLHNEFSRLLRIPSSDWLINFHKKINYLQVLFNKQEIWISSDVKKPTSSEIDLNA